MAADTAMSKIKANSQDELSTTEKPGLTGVARPSVTREQAR